MEDFKAGAQKAETNGAHVPYTEVLTWMDSRQIRVIVQDQ
jgi:hypothetical protein